MTSIESFLHGSDVLLHFSSLCCLISGHDFLDYLSDDFMRVSLRLFVLIPYPTSPIALLGLYANLPALIINQDYRRYLPDLIQLLLFLEMVLPAIVSIDFYILLVFLLWWGPASTPLCPPILFFLQLDSGHRGGWLPQTRKLSHDIPALLPLEHLLS